MRSSVCPALTTAAIVHGLSTDHDRRRGQRCTVLTHPVSLIHRGIFVQMNRATSMDQSRTFLSQRRTNCPSSFPRDALAYLCKTHQAPTFSSRPFRL